MGRMMNRFTVRSEVVDETARDYLDQTGLQMSFHKK